ncbi:CLUMA_CG013465, isoform A [Clunio marinus]|uniref:CLUMA_CG013465, isoform A n=1 Tax=Clunio marinus TaxID=568069 RepID=A0A1J1IIX1_9DIPT|nr:CLUMA_CG013465, isoform A [Clunio marinus]
MTPLSKDELQKILEDGKDSNLTVDDLAKFINVLMSNKPFLNSSVNTTRKLLIDETNYTQSDNCSEYCDGRMRNFFNEYKNYHGYITLIVRLAVCDMFVMIEYIPFTWHMYLATDEESIFGTFRNISGKPDSSYSWALYLLFHSHFSQILHTISILLTVSLAVWRYIAIKHPHGSLGFCIQNHYAAAILFAFILSPILCFPTFFVFGIKKIEDDNEFIYHLDANEDSELFRINFWIHSVIIKLLPCFILTIISIILIDVLCRANKRKLKLKGPSRIDRRTDRTTMLLVAVLLLFLITEFPQGIFGLLSGILGKRCYILVGETMDLLALINAAIGFVLYGSMSKQFRMTFKSLFFKERSQKIELTRMTNINNTTTNVYV